MKVVFTLCSINYLAQAFTLGKSLKDTNPQYRYVIGLVDRLEGHVFPEEISLLMNEYELLEVHTIGIVPFESMVARYDITELNTAVKPFYIDYFFKNTPGIEQVIYLDPDIIVYKQLNELDDNLAKHNFVITPHIMSPINDEKRLGERHVNNCGLYNLGFIGVKKSEESVRFIEWWKDRLEKYCYIRFAEGLFVDQLWINFLPLFFDNTHIERDPGYNMAYWNLHERKLFLQHKNYVVNMVTPLKFFHFSGYLTNEPEELSKYQNRFTLSERQDIVPLFEDYLNQLLSHHQNALAAYKCYYIKPKNLTSFQKFMKKRKKFLLSASKKLEKIALGIK